ncbi:MAG: gamma-glutamyltransferase, partial [Planctomycetes bacterium]|nr:gamma-glutamyltransferase [Planctomycetota bacterium]
MKRFVSSTWCVLVALCLLASSSRGAETKRESRADGGMVVSASRHASRIGREALRDGGNAVDAAVAVALALAVTWPEAGNLGGGGFMLIQPGDGREPACIDYRETAPVAATPTMYQADESRFTHRAVGVPGT